MSEYNAAYMQLNWGSGFYKNSYLYVKSLKDGKGGGIGGHWGGNDYSDTISTSGTRGGSRMYSETFYDRYRIKDVRFFLFHFFFCKYHNNCLLLYIAFSMV